MGVITEHIDLNLRDFAIDGIASSGAYNPPKRNLRQLGPIVEAQIAAAAIAGGNLEEAQVLITPLLAAAQVARTNAEAARDYLNAALDAIPDSVAQQLGDAVTAATQTALTAQAATETARDAAIAFLNPQLSQAAGEAATSEGMPFNFIDGNNQLVLAKRTAGGSDILTTFFDVARVSGAARAVSTRAALKATTDRTAPVLLTEANRRGYWVFVLGNFSAEVTADPFEGIYAKADGIAASLGAWMRIYDGPANALWFGLRNDNAPCQAEMTALMVNPFVREMAFPGGLYQAYLNNSISGRTFHVGEDTTFDGTVHIAVGTGPDTHEVSSITWVENTRVFGTLRSTVRVGSFYCDGLIMDRAAITDVDPSYVNQTAEGGTFGVHLYAATKNAFAREVFCESATAGGYALGVDRGPTNDDDHRPENIHIQKLIVRKNTQSIVSTLSTLNFTLDETDADSWDTDTAMTLTGDENLWFKKIRAIGSPTTAGKDGIYVKDAISAKFGEAEIRGSKQIGFRTFNCGRVDADVIRSSGNALNQVRIESPGKIGKIETSDAGSAEAVLIQGNAGGLEVDSINDQDGGGVTVIPDDVTVKRLISKGSLVVGKKGLNLNGADRFVNEYMLLDGHDEALRMINSKDPTLGVARFENNTRAIVGDSNTTGLAYRAITFENNGQDSNIPLNMPTLRNAAMPSDTAANIASAAAVLNSVGKSAGKQVWDTTNKRIMVASGSLPTSAWFVADGSSGVNPA